MVCEWFIYVWEYVHFLLRNNRDSRLGQHVDRITNALVYQFASERDNRKAKAVARMSYRYIGLMSDSDSRQRYQETLTRAGF